MNSWLPNTPASYFSEAMALYIVSCCVGGMGATCASYVPSTVPWMVSPLSTSRVLAKSLRAWWISVAVRSSPTVGSSLSE